ncbi:hypothetical protein N0V92_010465 [Colletotrichum tropicale]|nr:hypothetical protein N0V92_010465 [Colletotrichum tropicale]
MFGSEGYAVKYRITAACGAGFLLFGFDQGVFGVQGQIVASYDIGCIIGTILSMFFGDRLGRRWCILSGCAVLIVGGIMQAASYSIGPMIVGRVVAGVGNGMNTIAIPVWQSETAKPANRGKLIVLQLVTNIFGIVITNTLRRILLGAGTPVFQQLGGTNVIAYYLPIVLVRSFGMSQRMALILSAVDSMSLMFWGGMAAILIDRVGRKRLMLMGATCSGICFTIVAVGLCYSGPDNSNKSMSILAVVFIFLYYVFYGLSLLSIPFMYPAEINSQRMRNTGTSIATAVNWTGVYIVVVATPTAIDSIGWKYYLLFGIFNFVFVPIIWYWYVETANLSLEQVDRLFEIKHVGGKDMSWTEAARLARTEIHLPGSPRVEKDEVGTVNHLELVKTNRP